jgi:4-diphosphocytidyl-2C-methyl-D-erythritol kinase
LMARFFNVDRASGQRFGSRDRKGVSGYQKIKRLLLAHGAAGAMMTGSGSTVFGLFADKERAIISPLSLVRRNQQSKNWTLYVTDLLI